MAKHFALIACERCGGTFEPTSSQSIWCTPCRSVGCEACGETFVTTPSFIRKGARFCSVTCRHAGQQGGRHHSFNGYVSESTGGYLYFTDRHPTHPKIAVHRALWLEANPDAPCADCGDPVEVVHHLDEDKHNNVLTNLVGLCRPCHGRRHGFANRAEAA